MKSFAFRRTRGEQVPPVVHLVGAGGHEGVEQLDAVGRLQADPQFPEQAEAMKGQRFLEPLFQTADRRLVLQGELLLHPEQRRLRLREGGAVVGVLQAATDRLLLTLTEVADPVSYTHLTLPTNREV